MEIKKFKNELIAFDFDNEIVNATDMLRNYPEKRMNNFLRNEQTKEFIKVLERSARISAPDFKAVTQTINVYGKSSGTWMHKLLAYKFAAWLNPEFEVFIYSTFDKAVKKQVSELVEAKRQAEIREGYAWNSLDRNDLYS